jgi:hypothetical protein
MFLASHTEHAPWTVIDSDNKKRARINCIKVILNSIDYPNKIDSSELQIDKKIVSSADDKIEEFDNSVIDD